MQHKAQGKPKSLKNTNTQTAVQRFEEANHAAEFILTCAKTAQRSLDIYTNTLNPDIYAAPDFVQTVSAFARKSRNSKVRIIVQDSRPLHGRQHELIQLIQRLPSHSALKVLDRDYPPVDTGFCIADATSLCFFNYEKTFQGFYCEQAKAESKHALETFNHIWSNSSHPDPELRSFKL